MSFFCWEGFRWVLFSRFFWLFLLSCVSYLFVVVGNGWDELVEELGARKRGVFFFLKGDPGFSWTMILELHLK